MCQKKAVKFNLKTVTNIPKGTVSLSLNLPINST